MPQYKFIEFEDNKKLNTGLIHASNTSGQVFDITVISGVNKRINKSSVLQILPYSINLSLENALKDLASLIENNEIDIDVKLLWETLKDENEIFSFEDLMDILFDRTTNQLAHTLFVELHNDRIYFKKKKEGYEAKSERIVFENLRDEESRKAKDKSINEYIELVTNFINSYSSSTEFKVSDIKGSRSYTAILKSCAIFKDDYKISNRGKNLILKIAENCKIPSAPLWYASFIICKKLNIFSLHENLELLKYNISDNYNDFEISNSNIDYSDRMDFTNLLTVTIDDETTRDMDDALSIERISENHFKVYVHISDPTALISLNSPLHHEIRKRLTSLYLPEKTIHMLPEKLSCDFLSLIEGKKRPTITFISEIKENNIESSKIVRSYINVNKKLSYDEVDKIIDSTSMDIDSNIFKLLSEADKITKILRKNRIENGALEFNFPEPKIRIDDHQNINIKIIDTNSQSRKIVKEMMVLSNSIAGEFSNKNKLNVIYSTQGKPTGKLNQEHSLPSFFQNLKQMKKGEKSTNPAPHSGLGVNFYVQSSSPLRRYSDLIFHYQINSFLTKKAEPVTSEELINIMGNILAKTDEMVKVERSSIRYWQIEFLNRNRDKEFSAVVLMIHDNNPKSGIIFVNEVAIKAGINFRKKVLPGDLVSVSVIKANPRKNEIIFKHVK